MLNKLESVYLALLRGFILVAATIALLASALLVVATAPDILTRVGITATEPPRSSLAEFMAEQRPQETAASDGDATPKLAVDPDIAVASRNIRKYLGKRSTLEWDQGLQSVANELPLEMQARYGASLNLLSEELAASKGKPLSEKRVAELFEWHQRRFVSTVEQQARERAEADAAFKFKLAAAFAALMLFVFIAFIFLFVRIERNLRNVRVVQADEYA